jgi:hypothetical protein
VPNLWAATGRFRRGGTCRVESWNVSFPNLNPRDGHRPSGKHAEAVESRDLDQMIWLIYVTVAGSIC